MNNITCSYVTMPQLWSPQFTLCNHQLTSNQALLLLKLLNSKTKIDPSSIPQLKAIYDSLPEKAQQQFSEFNNQLPERRLCTIM